MKQWSSQVERKRGLAFTALGIAGLLVLGGCSAGSPADNDVKGEAASTFSYVTEAVPDTLDVVKTFRGDASHIHGYAWKSTLVIGQPKSGDGCETVPGPNELRGLLAESWSYSDDRMKLTFKLREGVLSPAGNEMTSEDVLWSLERAKELSGPANYFMFGVANLDPETTFTVDGRYEFSLNFAEPSELGLAILTISIFNILDSETIIAEAGDDIDTYLIDHVPNFGPWEVKSFNPGNSVEYVSNANYWDEKSRGSYTGFVVEAVADAGTRRAMVSSGSAQYTDKLNFDSYLSIRERGEAQVLDCQSPFRDTVLLNQADPVLADQKVRQAISMAVDRDSIVESVYKGLAAPAIYGLGPSVWTAPKNAEHWKYDPEKARALIEQAGATGAKIEMKVSSSRPGAWAESLALQVQHYLNVVGLDVSIRSVASASEFSAYNFDGNFQTMVYGENPLVADAYYSLILQNASWSPNAKFNYQSAEYDELARKVGVMASSPERDKLLSEAADIVVETVPQLYVTERRAVYVFDDKVDMAGFVSRATGAVLPDELSAKN